MINKFNILNGVKKFSSGIFQNCLVFIPAKKYIKYICGTIRIDSSISNGISEENIESITISDSNFVPTFVDHHILPDINFNGHCLTRFWLEGGGKNYPLPPREKRKKQKKYAFLDFSLKEKLVFDVS